MCLFVRERATHCFLFPSFVLLQAGRTRAVGIVGIERKLEEKRKETDKNISEVRERGQNLTELMITVHAKCYIDEDRQG